MRWVVVVLFALGAVAGMVDLVAPAEAGSRGSSGYERVTLFTSEVVAPSATATSSAWTDTGTQRVLYYQVTPSSSTPNLAIRWKGSVDGTNYAHTANPTVTTVTSAVAGMVAVTQPIGLDAVVELVNLSASITATCTVIGASR